MSNLNDYRGNFKSHEIENLRLSKIPTLDFSEYFLQRSANKRS